MVEGIFTLRRPSIVLLHDMGKRQSTEVLKRSSVRRGPDPEVNVDSNALKECAKSTYSYEQHMNIYIRVRAFIYQVVINS